MGDLFIIEIEPEVRLWLTNLSAADYERAEHAVGRLARSATTLSEPHSRHLGDGVRELRFDLGRSREAVRISYWLAPDRRVVLLTVFRKTRQRENAEVVRARRAKAVCEAEHKPAHDVFSRDV
ncbi:MULTISPECIES: type II toxin-antitoxin system RelE/ParE family toxin [Streptomyces]|uniref:type II toxin-antitoxin system RelE/ParE family toxin n=1 Tax=Streptomyces TaxID=1883 RepID=UPI002253B9A1|nr:MULTISPECIES: type II toxin-antitoxin system RelE/ParE family toxin [Streptomyces]MCX5343475.1 type II toxin-antitoxin system RelE/ParE family toxin [Streptomyces atratus]WSQ37687.1 type II toxin-antitoxin system RelE/ParE family toxin [Streptomyces sp. NBC_01224]